VTKNSEHTTPYRIYNPGSRIIEIHRNPDTKFWLPCSQKSSVHEGHTNSNTHISEIRCTLPYTTQMMTVRNGNANYNADNNKTHSTAEASSLGNGCCRRDYEASAVEKIR
jgi:hypothetical protein